MNEVSVKNLASLYFVQLHIMSKVHLEVKILWGFRFLRYFSATKTEDIFIIFMPVANTNFLEVSVHVSKVASKSSFKVKKIQNLGFKRLFFYSENGEVRSNLALLHLAQRHILWKSKLSFHWNKQPNLLLEIKISENLDF